MLCDTIMQGHIHCCLGARIAYKTLLELFEQHIPFQQRHAKDGRLYDSLHGISNARQAVPGYDMCRRSLPQPIKPSSVVTFTTTDSATVTVRSAVLKAFFNGTAD